MLLHQPGKGKVNWSIPYIKSDSSPRITCVTSYQTDSGFSSSAAKLLPFLCSGPLAPEQSQVPW